MIRALVLLALITSSAFAASSSEHMAKRPELFHPDTGLRIARQRAPTPDDVPGAARIDTRQVQELSAAGALLLDVGPALQSRFDELDGTWLVPKDHRSIPGAVWLPEVGRGELEPIMQRYLSANLSKLATDTDRAIVVFCMADCWMSWNAVQRIHALGYPNVFWFAEGVDGWLDQGWDLEAIEPVPVAVE